MKYHNHEAQPETPNEGEMRKKYDQNKRHIWNRKRTKKKNCNRRTWSERSVRKQMGPKLVWFARNLIANVDAPPNYKYMFGP